jgi:hypothetical protein
LVVEIARGGQEGRKIDIMFVVSDAEETLRQLLERRSSHMDIIG